jgi:type 1 glutamine amidotransferase
MNRRDMLRGSAAALAASAFPLGWVARADDQKKRKLLVYTRSAGFEHSVVKLGKDGSCLVDRIFKKLGGQHNFDVHATKDGRIFLPETLKEFDAVFFETTEDLTKEGGDKNPPMPKEGKQALIDFVASGKGFVGSHCASDTFHSAERGFKNQDPEKQDPYIRMLGGEFIRHGEQQKAWMRVADPKFPGLDGVKDFQLMEEWYTLKNFASDLHVILVQDSQGMRNLDYDRPNFPATWARKHEKGRVFYTSMGHREDVWENAMFQQILLGGLSWAFGNVEADVTPNLKAAAPQADVLPDPSKEKPKKK